MPQSIRWEINEKEMRPIFGFNEHFSPIGKIIILNLRAKNNISLENFISNPIIIFFLG